MCRFVCVVLFVVTFAVLAKSEPFLKESFDTHFQSRWFLSSDEKFEGEWLWESPKVLEELDAGVVDTDTALVVGDAAKHHAIATKLDSPIEFGKEKEVVIQYEVRYQEAPTCGGAYMKVLSGEDVEISKFSSDSPYSIMFGPDVCGTTDKVHFIFRYRNPLTAKFEEKHLMSPPAVKKDKRSHLYTLVLRSDNSFSVSVDGEVIKSGSLLDSFDPPVNPPEIIDDPEDKMPQDWVTEEYMPDSQATKPDDWDEDAPALIEDTDDEMPEGWMVDEPPTIADPDATKPEDWDDEEDGEWVAPVIENTACEVGCGEWTPRKVPNPEFKGKWEAPLIENPDYEGPWEPRKITNPDYYEDDKPLGRIETAGAVGFELWTMDKKITFDNMYIGRSEDEAKEFAEETWRPRFDHEKVLMEAEEKAVEEINQPILGGDIGEFIHNHGLAIIGSLIGLILAIFYLVFFHKKGKSVSSKEKPEEESKKDDAEEEENEDQDETEKENDDAEEEENEDQDETEKENDDAQEEKKEDDVVENQE